MKKTIIFNKGGLDAVATARNIIMELYSTLNKMAARLSMNSAAGGDGQFWRCLKKWSVDVIAAPCCGRLLIYLCAFRAILRLKSKRGIDTIAAPRRFPTA